MILSICFDFSCNIGFLIKCKAVWLSKYIDILCESKPSSCIIHLSQSAYLKATVAIMYSTSVVERATTFYIYLISSWQHLGQCIFVIYLIIEWGPPVWSRAFKCTILCYDSYYLYFFISYNFSSYIPLFIKNCVLGTMLQRIHNRLNGSH